MTDSLILYELQKIHEALTKTKEEFTLNFRMVKSTERFNFSEPILNTAKLGLIRLSVYSSVFNVNGNNNKFRFNSLDRQIFSDTKLYITSGAYELSEIAEIIKEETEGNVIIEVDQNTIKWKMEIKQGALRFDVENSIGSLLGFRKISYRAGTYNIHFRKLLILWVLIQLIFIVILYLELKILVKIQIYYIHLI